MKLLTPVQNNDLKAQELTRDVLRTQEMNKATEKARKNLAIAEADFNAALARQKHTWAIEEEKHQNIIKQRSQEVEELEHRKAQAMIPVKLYEDQVRAKEETIDAVLAEAAEEKRAAEELSERLQDKLDEVGEKEQGLIAREKRVASREAGATLQAEQVKQGVKQLNDKQRQFLADKATAEADIHERKAALFLWEQSLITKEETQKRTDTALYEKEIRLTDWEERLKREYKRLGLPLSS